jgi:hypothetical protein
MITSFLVGVAIGSSIVSLVISIGTSMKVNRLLNDEMTGTEYPTYEK